MDTLLQDLRYAVRLMRQSPGFTLAAVLALALGIGANSAVFSVVNGVLLRPLPYPRAQELTTVHTTFAAQGLEGLALSVPEYEDVRTQTRGFASWGALAQADETLAGADGPERLQVGLVTASWLPTLGVGTVLGRGFTPEEETPGRDKVVVLGHALWRTRFGADPGIVGRSVTLEGEPYTVVGVLAEGVAQPAGTQLYQPLALGPDARAESLRGTRYLQVLGRRAQGVSEAAAHAEVARVAGELARAHPEAYPASKAWRLDVSSLGEETVGGVRGTLWLLLGAVGFVLLIACTNVASLLLARAAARGRELSVRAALGAARSRLARQLLTESLLLSLLGGALGLLLALWGTEALVAWVGDGLPRASEVRPDAAVLLFTLAVSVGTGLLFGLAPALSGSRADLHAAMREGSRGTGGTRAVRLRSLFVVSQVALALVLLVGAGLLVRSFVRLQAVDPGFRPEGVLSARVSLPDGAYPDAAARARFHTAWLEQVRALPGVEAAGLTTLLPLRGRADRGLDVEGVEPPAGAVRPAVEYRAVSPGYLETLGVALRRGRALADTDGAQGAPVLLLNEAAVKVLFPGGEDPLGRRIRLRSRKAPQPWTTVVGVVGDVREWGLDVPARPTAYFSALQAGPSAVSLVVRTRAAPTALLGSLRTELARLDSGLPLFEVAPLSEVVEASVGQRSLTLALMLGFALVALGLAGLGLYGVIAFGVAQRSREVGIRLALGARPAQVLRLVVGQGLRLALAGVALGLVLALALGRLLGGLLYGVQPADPLTLLAVPLLLTGVALLASWVPARRATRVDPASTLRAE
ncbi:ABC transporter permease [Aggregicoccus sp. 17bor-14]|uniref:ABC transporter permease n=1 Tax=Myxococcaceae TaxID=31 RepID=UPI00129C8F90|nr:MULTISPECIES: ABC transporter permease [Myxococcaceae]MBF5045668.1 ABC transporter permease [Simulacricoccus sp. 17bor-14]MRI91405.1 ABC transporter permease [Aggregicoccus sp. 17bor-14]